MTAWHRSVDTLMGYGLAPEPGIAHGSCRDRRLIQPTTMGPPAILTDTRPGAVLARARFRRPPTQPRVCAVSVIVPLELMELQLQIRGRPEQRAVETLAPNRADQPFDEMAGSVDLERPSSWSTWRTIARACSNDEAVAARSNESARTLPTRSAVGTRRLQAHTAVSETSPQN